MKFRFPLKDVTTELASQKKEVRYPLFEDGFYSISQREFSLIVKGVASFYASGGNFISINIYPGADDGSIELYLNGSVYGAILHQRKIMPLHGSCFRYNGTGIMICGDAGAGKSSLTASFCLDGAEFLTDDVTPVLFTSGNPFIWALSDRLKLWGDTLRQLEQGEKFQRIENETEKYYYPMEGSSGDTFSLDQVYIIDIGDSNSVTIDELSGSSKFAALRREIYRPELLKGMPENEPVYFQNLVDICNSVKVFHVKRPKEIMVREMTRLLKEHGALGTAHGEGNL